MTKREHFELWVKDRYPTLRLDYNEEDDYYHYGFADLAYRAWLASPKTRPTEPSKISKEQLAAMRASTVDIVDHLRGIYPGIASPYPVSPLQKKAADEIERLRKAAEEVKSDLMLWADITNSTPKWLRERLYDHAQNLRAALTKTTTKEPQT